MYSSGAYYEDGKLVKDGCCEDTVYTNLIERYPEDGDFIFDIEYCWTIKPIFVLKMCEILL